MKNSKWKMVIHSPQLQQRWARLRVWDTVPLHSKRRAGGKISFGSFLFPRHRLRLHTNPLTAPCERIAKKFVAKNFA